MQCVSLGRRSFKVLATGGEDRKVNVWALGRPNALLSLSGHTSAISSVCFDVQEEVVVGGATSGTIKLWDLEQGKAIRTLLGHRSDCLAVDFHPYGAFFASASADTNLKVWDIRRKTCIQTYKGHSAGLSVVRFSPDGKWVVSGDEQGCVKLWDLSAGKLLYEYAHDGACTSLAFHPSELLMARCLNARARALARAHTRPCILSFSLSLSPGLTHKHTHSGGMDRCARITDLDTLQPLGQTAPEGLLICYHLPVTCYHPLSSPRDMLSSAIISPRRAIIRYHLP